MKKLIERAERCIDGYRLTRSCLYVYVFILPFQRFVSLRDASFELMLLFFAFKAARGRASLFLKDGTTKALLLLGCAALLSSAVSPYPGESFDFMRKNLFYQMAVFFVIINEFDGFDDMAGLFYALLSGFFAVSVVILAVNGPEKIIHWLDYKDKLFTSGYSLMATFYMPLLVAYVFTAEKRLWVSITLYWAFFFEFVMSVLNNHRTQVVAIIAGVSVVTFLAGRYRTLVAGAVVCVIITGALIQVKPDSFERYKFLLSPENFASPGERGWNGRLEIWSGTIDMIKERPVLGWGYGWKKIKTVAVERGYLDKWKGPKPGTYRYFSVRGYGGASPHNLVLQVLFELGIVGLAALVWFWLTVLGKAVAVLRDPESRRRPGGRFLVCGVFGVLVSYLLINVSNALWEETSGNLMMIFAAVSVVVYRAADKGRGVSLQRGS